VASCVVSVRRVRCQEGVTEHQNITGVARGRLSGAAAGAGAPLQAVRQGKCRRRGPAADRRGAGQISQGARRCASGAGLWRLTLVGVARSDRRPGQRAAVVYGVATPGDPEATPGRTPRGRDPATKASVSESRVMPQEQRVKRVGSGRVPGLGPAKRLARLLSQFGGLQGVMRAGVADLNGLAGIGANGAKSYDKLHPGS